MSFRSLCRCVGVFCFVASAGVTLHAQSPASTPSVTGVDLQVQITDVTSRSGQIRISVFAGEDGFPRDIQKAITSTKIDPSRATHTFKDLPPGVYAVTVLHDLNNNGEVDTNFVGMPKEPIGLSRYQTIGMTNLPDFKKAAFRLERSSVLKVKLLEL